MAPTNHRRFTSAIRALVPLRSAIPNRPPFTGHTGWEFAALALLAAILLLVLATSGDYGITIDEYVQNEYGKLVLNYYLSGFQDRAAFTYKDLYYYGGLFDGLTALANRLSPLGVFETRHLLNALVGLAGLAGCGCLGRRLAGPRAGFLAIALLTVTPIYYGQMFDNPKDIPFAVGYVWSLVFLLEAMPQLPAVSLRTGLKLGVGIGLTLGVRVGGLMLFGYLLVPVAAHLVRQARGGAGVRNLAGQTAVIALRFLLPVLVVAYVLMLLAWPWAQAAPLGNPLAALRHFTHLDFDIPVLHQGHTYRSADLPPDYLLVTLLIRLPEIVGPILLYGVIAGIVRGIRQRGAAAAMAATGYGLVALAAAFPLAYIVARHSTVFDGMRHITFVVPPLIALCAAVLSTILGSLRTRMLQTAAQMLLACYAGWIGWTMARLHPDEYIFHNQFVGGVPGAADRFELDYWEASYREATLDLVQYLKGQYGPALQHLRFRVLVCNTAFPASYYFPSYLQPTTDRSKADFFLAFTRQHCDQTLPGKPVVTVARLGVVLSVVRDRRQILANAPIDFR